MATYVNLNGELDFINLDPPMSDDYSDDLWTEAELGDFLPLEPAIALDSRVIYTPPRRSKARIGFVRDYDHQTGWYFVEYWLRTPDNRVIATGGWVPVESLKG